MTLFNILIALHIHTHHYVYMLSLNRRLLHQQTSSSVTFCLNYHIFENKFIEIKQIMGYQNKKKLLLKERAKVKKTKISTAASSSSVPSSFFTWPIFNSTHCG